MLSVSRLVFVQVLGRDRFARRVLVYGAGAKAAEVQNVRVRQDLRNFQVVGYILTEGCQAGSARRVAPESRQFPARFRA
jgi:hypothetical protein